MRYAVAVPAITRSTGHNLRKVMSMMSEASTAGANVVLFPEAVLTGLNLCDDHDVDKHIAYSLESLPVQAIIGHAERCAIWTAFGFLELAGTTIYDSAILVDNNGRIALHYRRMSPGWKAKNADPLEYGSGASLPTAITPWGKTAALICGDLFETAFPLAVEARLDFLLFPFARCFSPKVTEPQRQWNDVEWPDYSAQIGKVGALTLMSNYVASGELNGGGFGGGFIVGPDGGVIKAKPLLEEGLLVWDQPTG